MKRKQRKAFTIVELVIVIAVIGVLTAVLIPTFVNLTNKAQLAENQTFVKNINTQLAINEAEEGKNKTAHEAIMDAFDMGFDVRKLTPVNGNDIIWDEENDRFAIVAGDFATNTGKDHVIYADAGFKTGDDVKLHKLWKLYDFASMPQTGQTYSIYAKGNDWTGNIALTVGFDAGDNTGISSITYATANNNEAVIRTNNKFGSLTIDALNGEVSHFGDVGDLNIIAVKKASYDEYGRVGGVATLTYGKINVKEKAEITTIVANPASANDVELVVENAGVVGAILSENQDVIDVLVDGNETKVNYTEKIDEGQTETVSSSVAYVSHSDASRTYYDSFDLACNNATNDETVVVMKDYRYDAVVTTTLISIAAEKNVTIDLNGKIIQGVLTNKVSSDMIKVYGNLILKDSTSNEYGIGSGAFNFKTEFQEANPWTVSAGLIKTSGTGIVTVLSGKIVNETGSGGYAIDIYPGTTLNVEGGLISCGYNAIRLFANSTTITTTLNVSGGKIEGGSCGVYLQQPQGAGKYCLIDVNISGGNFVGGRDAVVVWDCNGDSVVKGNIKITLSGNPSFSEHGSNSRNTAYPTCGDIYSEDANFNHTIIIDNR